MGFESSILTNIFLVVRFILFLNLYIGFTVVIISVCLHEHPNGREYTPPLSPAMQCVIFLSVQFFAVYLCLAIANMVKSFGQAPSPDDPPLSERSLLVGTFESARSPVSLCPMLSILFL